MENSPYIGNRVNREYKKDIWGAVAGTPDHFARKNINKTVWKRGEEETSSGLSTERTRGGMNVEMLEGVNTKMGDRGNGNGLLAGVNQDKFWDLEDKKRTFSVT